MEVEGADCYVDHVGYVEGLDAYCGVESIIGYEEAYYGEDHRIHYSPGCNGSNVDAVIDKGRSTESRHYP